MKINQYSVIFVLIILFALFFMSCSPTYTIIKIDGGYMRNVKMKNNKTNKEETHQYQGNEIKRLGIKEGSIVKVKKNDIKLVK